MDVGMLVQTRAGAGRVPPEERPVGRAALRLRAEGVRVVFGDDLQAGRLSGFAARPGGWEPVRDAAVRALHDRFPSQTRPDRYARILAERGDLPMGNPPALTLLCRDKLESQRHLEAAGLSLPPVEPVPARFQEQLQVWGTGFLKPRYGALGRGVRRVQPGDPLPTRGEGAVPGRPEPMLLQRAVQPPPGWRGQAVRVLVQRVPHGGWLVASRVLRRSRTDPVVNAARGAEVRDADHLLGADTLRLLDDLSLRVATVLAAHPHGLHLVELGVDAVIDAQGAPRLLEVNSRPRGRLEVLAREDPQEYSERHVQACARPFRYLAAVARG